MKKNLLAIALSLVVNAAYSNIIFAETVLEKIERTGIINVGTRPDAIPFSYLDDNNWSGYSLELIKLIHQDLQQKLNKPIQLNITPVTLKNRFLLVEEESLDLVCEATTITQSRLEKVDFSIPYFMTGTQFLIKKQDAHNFNLNSTLDNLSIAYLPDTTTDQIIRQIYPQANWIAVNNRHEGLIQLQSGNVKAIASDGILLIGEVVTAGDNPQNFLVIPYQPMTTELYGCMFPKNNSDWKQLIDEVISSKTNQKLLQQWFNAKTGKYPYLVQTFP